MPHLADLNLAFIEEPTSPDDILGHAKIRKALKPYGIGVATGEHVVSKCHKSASPRASSIYLNVDIVCSEQPRYVQATLAGRGYRCRAIGCAAPFRDE